MARMSWLHYTKTVWSPIVQEGRTKGVSYPTTMLLESSKSSALSKTSLPRKQYQEWLTFPYGKDSKAANVVWLSLFRANLTRFLVHRVFSCRMIYDSDSLVSFDLLAVIIFGLHCVLLGYMYRL